MSAMVKIRRSVFASVLLLAGPAIAQSESQAKPAGSVISVVGEADRLAKSIASVVGTAISPLVGIGLLGSYGWWNAPDPARAELPWYNQPWAWGSVLALIALVALKDTVGGIVPLAKKPLDALELIENKLSALVALPIVVHVFLRGLTLEDRKALSSLLDWLVPTAHAYGSDTTAMDLASLGALGALATVAFVVVWMTGHVVNVLVFLSPFGFLDSLLKLARLAVVGLVLGTAAVHPGLGIVTSLVVVLLSLVMFGWSLRFTTLGALMAVDVLSGRHDDPVAEQRGLRVFTCAGFSGLPARTMGRLRRDGAVLEFRYRPLLMLPGKVVHLPQPPQRYEVGEGLLTPTLLLPGVDASYRLIFRFAPRYRRAVVALRATLAAGGIRDVSVRRGLAALWSFLCGLVRDENGAVGAEPRANGAASPAARRNP